MLGITPFAMPLSIGPIKDEKDILAKILLEGE